MVKVLLDEKKGFYKGNMHCHSSLSDGSLTPSELKRIYKEKGYSFLAITDHEKMVDNSYLDDENFITITSAEYAIKEFANQSTLTNRSMKVCHLNLYAVDQHNTEEICYNSAYDHYSTDEERAERSRKFGEYEREYSSDGINEIVRLANENGFFVSYNHPRWSLENYGQYGKYEGLWGVEIFNTGCDRAGLYEYDINVLDDFLRDGKRIFATCGDDNHNKKDDSFGAFIMVNTDALSYESIICALRRGDFYTSTGPIIKSLVIQDGRVKITCSNAKQISISADTRYSKAIHAEEGRHLEGAEFELVDDMGYFRIDVKDNFGGRANTQAYFLSDIK